MHPALQVLAVCLTIFGTLGGIGFLFWKSVERLDRNFESIQAEIKDFHGVIKDIHARVCIIEEKYHQLEGEKKCQMN